MAGTLTVSLAFSGLVDGANPPNRSPFLDGFSALPSQYLSQNGGPVDPSTWHYYTFATGTVTGGGAFAGFSAIWAFDPDVDIAFQVGEGATGRHLGYGASGWFDVEMVSQPSGFCFREGDQLTELFLDLPNCSCLLYTSPSPRDS